MLQAQPEFADRDPQGDAHEDPVERAVGDRQDRSLDCRVCVRMRVVGGEQVDQEGAHPGRHVVARFTARARDPGRIRFPGLPLSQVAGIDLGVGQAFPMAVVHLAQAGIGLDRRLAR